MNKPHNHASLRLRSIHDAMSLPPSIWPVVKSGLTSDDTEAHGDMRVVVLGMIDADDYAKTIKGRESWQVIAEMETRFVREFGGRGTI